MALLLMSQRARSRRSAALQMPMRMPAAVCLGICLEVGSVHLALTAAALAEPMPSLPWCLPSPWAARLALTAGGPYVSPHNHLSLASMPKRLPRARPAHLGKHLLAVSVDKCCAQLRQHHRYLKIENETHRQQLAMAEVLQSHQAKVMLYVSNQS